MSTMIIGIAGGTGCGKTTITDRLKEKFSRNISVVYHDSYYKCNDHLPMSEREKINYDCPDAFDTDLMIEHLKTLRDGKAVDCPVYDYKIHNRTKETVRIEPAEVIIVEGILIFDNEELRNMFDIKIFVDTDADVRILRRLRRDVVERKRTVDSIIEQYLTTVKPMHEKYVEPTKKYADIVFLGGGRNEVAFDMVSKRVKHHIRKENQNG